MKAKKEVYSTVPEKKSGFFFQGKPFSRRIINNEEGFVLVLSLMVLVVLTLLGISASRTSVIEVQIAGNDNKLKMDFYKREAAAHEMAQLLENEENPEKLKAARTSFVWLSASDIDAQTEKEKLLEGGEAWKYKSAHSELSDTDAHVDVDMAALDYGVVKGDKGTSLKLSESRVYFYKLIGKTTRGGQEKMIELGYKKRY
jgi:hypothetical protein